MRTTNAFSSKTFGKATLQQKVRERQRRAIKEVVLLALAPVFSIVRAIVGLAKRVGLVFNEAVAVVSQTLARLTAILGRAARAIWRSGGPVVRLLGGALRKIRSALWRPLRPIIVGTILAPRLAAAEANQFVAAVLAVRKEIARLGKLGADNARRIAKTIRQDILAASKSLGKRALTDFLAVRKRALGLSERTRLFLVETSDKVRQGGHVLLRTLKASGQAVGRGLKTGAINLGRGFLEIWTAPINLMRRFAHWLPVAVATLGRIASRAGITGWRFLGNTLGAMASVLLIAGFTILFVVMLLSRGAWTLVQASAMASVWIAFIAAKITWWAISSLGLVGAYISLQLGRLVGTILRSALRSLAAAYAAMPQVFRFLLRPIIAVHAAARKLLLVSARATATALLQLAQAFYRQWLTRLRGAEQLWSRITAIRLPHLTLQQRGEEALAYAAVASLSIALLISTSLLEPVPPQPSPQAATVRTAVAKIMTPPQTVPELKTGELIPSEKLAPEIKDPPAPEPKMAYAKPPVVKPPAQSAEPGQRPVPRTVPPGTAKIAIVIDDMGMKRGMTRPFARLPGRLTFAFLPYAGDLRRQTRRVREAGHELLVHLPMEPESRIEDPGPNALLTRLSPEELAGRIKWNLNRFDGFVGINNHMGSLFTQSHDHMRPVMEAMRTRRLVYLDSKTSPTDVGTELAEEMGVPWVVRDIFLDNVRTRVAIDEQLARTIRIAQRRGQVVAIGHNYQVTLDALRDWLPEIQNAGFQLVTISELVYGKQANAGGRQVAGAGAGQK
jgi:polysaccharide deacetylase 2 family uncharacterized protein YibQ